MASLPTLPVSEVLQPLGNALRDKGIAVLTAPPGAGKTTLVPLFLLDQQWLGNDRIILLEPRRLAARAAAARMASLLGESVGQTVGLRMRMETKVSGRTRIEVVTEGVFARMVLDDPALEGVGAVLFDEFHERSLDADFGLALALDVRNGLREDLRILVMSATLDVDRVLAILPEAPVIKSEGRTFPIALRHEDRPPGERIEDAMVRVVRMLHDTEPGSMLAFLPGQAEIGRVAERLETVLPATTRIMPLYGNLSQAEQKAAIEPVRDGARKVVLATSIAETSITIDGVRIVIDSGLQRIPVYEPSTGITRLETVRVSRASADQRAGRAGRTEPGIAVRLWHAGQTAALPAHSPPQILSSDLSGLALDLAHWGVQDTGQLSFIDHPPGPALAEARALLRQLGALDGEGRLTRAGQTIRNMALPPRLAAMVLAAGETGHAADAAALAVILTEPGLGGSDVDLNERLRRFRQDRGERASQARKLADRLAASAGGSSQAVGAALAGDLLVHAFADRIALRRGGRGRFVMANGRGAELPETERLANASMLVIADLSGKAAQARVLAAAETTRPRVEAALPDAIIREEQSYFDRDSRQLRARRVTRIGAILLEETPLARPTGDLAARALAEGVRELGIEALPFSRESVHLRERLGFLHRALGAPWPDVSDDALLARLDEWFVPYQGDVRGLADISASSLSDGLRGLVPHDLRRELDRLAPTHFEAPTGQRHPIRYEGEEPVLAIRVQELFGLKTHPSIGGGKWPLLLELTSPAQRPIQTTRDLPGFWAGSWKDVRSEMRGRYPKHPWPDDPANAAPTHRAKPRGT
ncbi:ATP-dependent helicase HrpB [Gellertiella hungarica]|uniref:ATP-dependent helicase HrpB n=1 Tax=Gellertiella hungarica TaxID=1572859 RepID=A0A7W6J8R1_9HYPH|nr:ATP-dependent helicase HrpB [Gellertiella hungarica]MBB4066911.1 ATP-dependent helicase HrpB [Gellertiella hungarica]